MINSIYHFYINKIEFKTVELNNIIKKLISVFNEYIRFYIQNNGSKTFRKNNH